MKARYFEGKNKKKKQIKKLKFISITIQKQVLK